MNRPAGSWSEVQRPTARRRVKFHNLYGNLGRFDIELMLHLWTQ